MEEEKLLKRKKKAYLDNNNISLIATCINLAEYYFIHCKYDSAIVEYKIVADKYNQMRKPIDYARCNRMIGEAYAHLKQYNKALKHQQLHLKIANEENNNLEKQRALATIGHTYLTRYEDTSNIEDLSLAEKSFKESLDTCERLTGISQRERMDMTARLYANLGVVEECLGNYDKALLLVQKSVNICEMQDILEQLQRGYSILGSIYCKKEDYKSAIYQYNLASDVASRLEDKATLMSAVLVAKGEIFIKLSDFHNAKDTLHKAYKLIKLKCKNEAEVESIKQTLKIVAVMSYTEDHLLSVDDKDYETKKQLYEKMGDGASSLKLFSKAIEYYEKMLQAAISKNELEENMGPCYFSLAQTYLDNEQHSKALEFFKKYYQVCKNNLKESTSTLLSIAELMDILGKSSDDIEITYEQAVMLCREASDNQLEGKLISKYVTFLKKYNLDSKAKQWQEQLNKPTCYVLSDTDSDGTDIQTTSNIGDEISINDITDVSEDENELVVATSTRKRNKAVAMKKNQKGETQLHTACINGNTAAVQHLLERGHMINVRDHCGWLPIHEACNHGYLPIVKLLVENGAALNDRGGTKCDGITPLHDAAINGHLDIVEYLIEKGASIIAKKDDGETSLHCLTNWRRSVKDLDFATQAHYQSIRKHMMDALERSGHDKDTALENNPSTSALVTESEDLLVQAGKTKINYSLTSSDEEEMAIDKRSISDHSSDTEDFNCKTKATEQYQEVMKSLRYRVDLKRKVNKSQSVLNRPALLESEEVGDDWLDDDVSRLKRRKTFSPYTSTSSIRNINQTSSSTYQEPAKSYKSLSRYSDSNISDKDFKENYEPVQIITKRNKRQTSLINAGFTAERSPSPSPYCNQMKKGRSQQNVKHNQVKLTSFCGEGGVVEADSTTVSPIRQRRASKRYNSKVAVRNDMEEVMLSADVRINGKLYKVPIPYTSKNTLTIKWLAEEAAKRFCRKEYMKPILELETKNGALLADDDYVSILFPSGATLSEEVNATIVKWHVPPLIQRYKEACAAMNIDEDPILSQSLVETSTVLDLSNHNFGSKALKPFCKAINRQTNLRHLDLSGTFISNECVELLCSSLPSLENLTVLNLSMNLITSDGLHHIANLFSNQTERTLLENLISLDLSYNSLGNECLRHLAVITRYLKLQTLKLVDVGFTSEIFDDFSNSNVELYLDYLEELDISENRMGKDDILRFILWIRPANLQILNVSNNIIIESGLVVEIVRAFEANSTAFWKLKCLSFSRCGVTDAEVYELLRLLAGAEHFSTLNLSYNEQLSSISLRRLFEYEFAMRNLYLEGCPEILKYFENANECSWKLSEQNNIKNLRLSIDSRANATECNTIVSIWKNKHHERSKIISTKCFIELSVK